MVPVTRKVFVGTVPAAGALNAAVGGASSRLNVSNFFTAGEGSEAPPMAKVRAVARSLTLPGMVNGSVHVVPPAARVALMVFAVLDQVVRLSWRYCPPVFWTATSTRRTPAAADDVPLISNSSPEFTTRPMIGSVMVVSTPLPAGTVLKSNSAIRPTLAPPCISASPPVTSPREVTTMALLPS